MVISKNIYSHEIYISLLDSNILMYFKNSNEKILSKKETIINKIISRYGIIGLIFVYIFMVLRNTTIKLPRFQDIVIVDIPAGLITKKQKIALKIENIIIQRRHFPQIRIIRELIVSHREYVIKCKKQQVEYSDIKSIQANVLEWSSQKKTVPKCPSSCKFYLYYLLHFYIHRSIILANREVIISNVSSVVTIQEFTPQVLGYLSALSDFGFPTSLYMAIRQPDMQLKFKTLNMFSQIIASNGIDADFVKENYKVPIHLEKKTQLNIKLNSFERPRIGVFLGSMDGLKNEDLVRLYVKYIIPFLRMIENDWNIDSLIIYCHPSDQRSCELLVSNNFKLYYGNSWNEKRMLAYDVVVCGNTSVIEEALNQGVPVVYSGKLDNYNYDLLKYVSNGIVFDATQSLPSLDELHLFYVNSKTRDNLTNFFNGSGHHEELDFIEAICNP